MRTATFPITHPLPQVFEMGGESPLSILGEGAGGEDNNRPAGTPVATGASRTQSCAPYTRASLTVSHLRVFAERAGKSCLC